MLLEGLVLVSLVQPEISQARYLVLTSHFGELCYHWFDPNQVIWIKKL